jgi:hypothetical protein
MKQYVLYQSPSDYPDKWVIREWHIVPGNPEPVPVKEPYLISEDLRNVFVQMNQLGLTWLNRMPTDDPCIEGVWI